LRDFLVGVAESEEPQHLPFAFGEGIGLRSGSFLRLGGDHACSEGRMNIASTLGDLAEGRNDLLVDGFLEHVAVCAAANASLT